MRRKITLDECQVRFEQNPCLEVIKGNASAIDPATDKKVEDEIQAELTEGNTWAWCDITLLLIHSELGREEDHLGCCSFESEEAFRKSGVYDDMLSVCLEKLNARAERIISRYG